MVDLAFTTLDAFATATVAFSRVIGHDSAILGSLMEQTASFEWFLNKDKCPLDALFTLGKYCMGTLSSPSLIHIFFHNTLFRIGT